MAERKPPKGIRRLKDGRFQALHYVKGKQYSAGTWSSPREAERALRKARVEVDENRHLAPSRLTIKKFLEAYLEHRDLAGIEVNTRRLYRLYERYVAEGQLGAVLVQHLTPLDVEDAWKELMHPKNRIRRCRSCAESKPLDQIVPHRGRRDGVDNICLQCRGVQKPRSGRHAPGTRASGEPPVRVGLSAKAATDVMNFLKTALNHAIKLRLIRANPVTLAEMPRVERKQVQPLSLDGARRFSAVLHSTDDPYADVLGVGLFTMIRIESELLGAAEGDFDLDRGLYHFQQVMLEGAQNLRVPEVRFELAVRS